ncbi:FG-GAP repeat domain-containing protein [Streptomyces sp. NPDC049040]|uniref:FG-GAP repeat domain-containing protein n=1 Tax=Streptomyces sp. NPDC049040 TaxID=3365593 RepID=UPI003713C8C1
MLSLHTGRRRLGAAIATVLAVTLGSAALIATPAGAAGAAATVAPSGLLPMVPGATLASVGSQGFMTDVEHHDPDMRKLRYVPYGGGAPHDMLYYRYEGAPQLAGDLIVTSPDGFGAHATDVSTGDGFFTQEVDDGRDGLYGGVAGHALFLRGATKLWLETADAAPRALQGIPEKAPYGQVVPGDAGHGLLSVGTADGGHLIGLVDLSDATVSYPYPAQARDTVVSGNHVAWVEDDTAAHTLRVVVRDRTTGADTTVQVPGSTAGADLAIGLLGDWVTYGTTAVHITTGERVTLLAGADTASTTPDGSARIIQGSSSTQGDGIFRVTIGTDGRPAVQLLAHAGTPTSALHDFDNDGLADLLGRDAAGVLWRDSAGDGLPRARIGGGWQIYDKIEPVGDVVGDHSPDFLPELVARDKDGVLWLYSGQEDGTLTPRVRIGGGWQGYTHLTGGSDFTGDGRPDLTAVDAAGNLWLYAATGDPSRPFENRRSIGTGWDIYNEVTEVGNLAGAPAGDLVARDKDGVLWLYLSKGDGTFTQRTKIGGGWQGYSHLVAGGDVDHDGIADLFAYHPGTNTVYLYSGTGDRTRPFDTRVVSDAQTGNAYDRLS